MTVEIFIFILRQQSSKRAILIGDFPACTIDRDSRSDFGDRVSRSDFFNPQWG